MEEGKCSGIEYRMELGENGAYTYVEWIKIPYSSIR
jgi:hypothetical protein